MWRLRCACRWMACESAAKQRGCLPALHPPWRSRQADELLALAAHARADMQTCHPGAAPAFFLAGHSLGGLVAALACLRDPRGWAGLMLCSPALGVKMGLKLRVQAAVAHAISACFPGARLVEAVDPFDMNPGECAKGAETKRNRGGMPGGICLSCRQPHLPVPPHPGALQTVLWWRLD